MYFLELKALEQKKNQKQKTEKTIKLRDEINKIETTTKRQLIQRINGTKGVFLEKNH